MTYDRKPEPPRKPIQVAGDLVRRENDPLANEAARTIRDLVEALRAICGRYPQRQAMLPHVKKARALVE